MPTPTDLIQLDPYDDKGLLFYMGVDGPSVRAALSTGKTPDELMKPRVAIVRLVVHENGPRIEVREARCGSCRHYLRYFTDARCGRIDNESQPVRIENAESSAGLGVPPEFGCLLFEPKEPDHEPKEASADAHAD